MKVSPTEENGYEKRRLSSIVSPTAPVRRQVVSTLRRAIETGVLKPGVRLLEKDLSRELNVSRTSLREAMRELETEGLISYQATRSIVVREISREEAENIYLVRKSIEALVAEQFARRRNETAIHDLLAATGELRRCYQAGNINEIVAAKAKFYRALCEGARNTVAIEILERLNSRTSHLRSISLSRENRGNSSMAEIQVMVDSIVAGDVEAARYAAELHVTNAARSAFADG